MNNYFGRILIITVILHLPGIISQAFAQNNDGNKYLYHPKTMVYTDTVVLKDSTQMQIPDSLELIRLQHVRDSIEVREQFVRDSIIAREIFVRDSIIHRQHVLDSLNLIKEQLPILLDVALKTYTDNIILSANRLSIIGDSSLNNYTGIMLPFTTDQPFTPWKNTINLSDKPVKLMLDSKSKRITSINGSGISCSFAYGSRPGILIMTGKGMIATINSGKVYKLPVDSVFLDQRGRILKIKRYFIFSQVVNNYQQGALLYTWLSQVKQFEYSTDNQLTKYQLVNFCERTATSDGKKVCFMANYTITRQGMNYILTRRNDPPNEYSDGTFTFEFDNTFTLKSIAFVNLKQSEDWKTFIELNEVGNVSSYVYQKKGVVKNTLLFNYYLDDPKAKYKIESISCTFEDDGVSYFQVNNTTGKSRVRDHLTMEWSTWK